MYTLGPHVLRKQIAVHHLSDKWSDRRNQFRERDQHGMQRLIRGQFVGPLLRFPESSAITAYVPIAEPIIDKLFHFKTKRHHVEGFKTRSGLANEHLQVRENPAIDVGPLRDWDRCHGWIEGVGLGVIDEESVG